MRQHQTHTYTTTRSSVRPLIIQSEADTALRDDGTLLLPRR